MTGERPAVNWVSLGGALLLSFAFGSLHAFGALMQPLERWLHASRGNVSLGYSLAIVALTVGVLLGPRAAAFLGAPRTALSCGVLGGLGLALPALAPETSAFLLGYSVVFGFGNGIAYGLSLERAATAMPGGKGIAIGAATAAYGGGAAVFAQIIGPVAAAFSIGAGLWLMALSVGLAGLAAAATFAVMPEAARPLSGEPDPPMGLAAGSVIGLRRLWLIYFLGACGGLMITAHANAIVAAWGAGAVVSGQAVTSNAFGNIVGSAFGGLVADRLRTARALAVPLLVSVVAMIALSVIQSGAGALAMLTLCGLAYGGLIATVPVVIRKEYGPGGFGRAFGLVFTAWGAGGLAGPYLAGLLYDLRQNYSVAIAAATGCALIALLLSAIRPFPKRPALPQD